eukprot:jgi/Tetstr1/440407/TSEL_028741.t1
MDELLFGSSPSSPSSSYGPRSAGLARHLSDSGLDTYTPNQAEEHAPGGLFAPTDRAGTSPLPLGTSAPIDIKWVSSGQRSRAMQARANLPVSAKQVSQTFVPPHLMTAQLASQYFLDQCVSPTASLKKEKLRVRDAVLRSTGYQ